jgi:hypothetical protein
VATTFMQWKLENDMLVKGINFNGCDICFDSTIRANHAYVSRGATGRYCAVLSVCNDCAPKEHNKVWELSEARTWCDSQPNSWSEF